ncbi:hypothetical protein [Bacillus aquiflavi]|nr:hypothetical protein [Bacillus aquiflavi]
MGDVTPERLLTPIVKFVLQSLFREKSSKGIPNHHVSKMIA